MLWPSNTYISNKIHNHHTHKRNHKHRQFFHFNAQWFDEKHEWDTKYTQDKNKNKNFEAEIQIKAIDRRGLFTDVSRILADEKITVNGINARTSKDGTAIMNVVLEVLSKEQLKSIMNQIRRVEGVIDIFRLFN